VTTPSLAERAPAPEIRSHRVVATLAQSYGSPRFLADLRPPSAATSRSGRTTQSLDAQCSALRATLRHMRAPLARRRRIASLVPAAPTFAANPFAQEQWPVRTIRAMARETCEHAGSRLGVIGRASSAARSHRRRRRALERRAAPALERFVLGTKFRHGANAGTDVRAAPGRVFWRRMSRLRQPQVRG